MDDFISPRYLRIDPSDSESGSQIFFASRLYLGADINYQFRNEFPENDIGFVRVANSIYYSTLQVNAKITRFESFDESRQAIVPRMRTQLELGVYVEHEDESEAVSEEPGRFTLLWNMENGINSEVNHEFGIKIGIKEYEWGDIPGYGGLIYTYRPSEARHYIAMGYRYRVGDWSSGSHWNVGYSISGESVAGDWRFGLFRLETSPVLAVLPGESYVHIHYAFALRLSDPGESLPRINNELGAFINVPILALLR